MSRKKAILAIVFALGLAALLVHGQDPNLDSLQVCKDTQKLIFENAFVRIIDDVIPPNVAEPLHRHPRGVVVTLVEADAEVSNSSGEKTKRHYAIGATWNEPTVHAVRNIGSTPTHWIRIDIK